MGAKVSLVAWTHGTPRAVMAVVPDSGPEKARAYADQVAAGGVVESLGTRPLGSVLHPPDGTVWVAVFGESVVVADRGLERDLVLARPDWLDLRQATFTELSMHSVSSSVHLRHDPPGDDPGREIYLDDQQPTEDILEFATGRPLAFEEPFWSGRRDYDGEWLDPDAATLPFSAMDYGEEALRWLFGFPIEGAAQPDDLDPWRIPAHGFRVTPTAPPTEPVRVPWTTYLLTAALAFGVGYVVQGLALPELDGWAVAFALACAVAMTGVVWLTARAGRS